MSCLITFYLDLRQSPVIQEAVVSMIKSMPTATEPQYSSRYATPDRLSRIRRTVANHPDERNINVILNSWISKETPSEE